MKARVLRFAVGRRSYVATVTDAGLSIRRKGERGASAWQWSWAALVSFAFAERARARRKAKRARKREQLEERRRRAMPGAKAAAIAIALGLDRFPMTDAERDQVDRELGLTPRRRP